LRKERKKRNFKKSFEKNQGRINFEHLKPLKKKLKLLIIC